MTSSRQSAGALRVALLCVLALAASACSRGTADLETRIADIKARKGAPLEPLPVMKTFETFEYAAAALGVPAARAVVIEDAVTGVAAGRAGGFGLVIGVDRGAGAQTLREAGADAVVSDLAELMPA